MKNLAESLKERRKNQQITQEDLAEALHVSRQAISSWETGKTEPDGDTLLAICDYFNVSVDELLNHAVAKAPKEKERSSYPLAFLAFGLAALHLVFAFQGRVATIGVMMSCLLPASIALIMGIAFESSIQSRDFTLIAGHKKADEVNFPRYSRQLRWMSAFVSGLALLLNLLYFAAYTAPAERQMPISLIFFLVFVFGLPTVIWLVNAKYRK